MANCFADVWEKVSSDVYSRKKSWETYNSHGEDFELPFVSEAGCEVSEPLQRMCFLTQDQGKVYMSKELFVQNTKFMLGTCTPRRL